MDGSTLHVDPVALRRGAEELSGFGDEMAELVKTVGKLHSTLQEQWSGPTTALVNDLWVDNEP